MKIFSIFKNESLQVDFWKSVLIFSYPSEIDFYTCKGL